MALGTAMQKIESAIIAVVLGIAFPFVVTYLVSGGGIVLLPDTLHLCGERVCQVGTVSGNVITLPDLLVSTANLVITLLVGRLASSAYNRRLISRRYDYHPNITYELNDE